MGQGGCSPPSAFPGRTGGMHQHPPHIGAPPKRIFVTRDLLRKGARHKSLLVPHRQPQWSSISLLEEGILHHTKPLFEVCKLHSGQGLGEYVSNLLIGGDVLELHCSLLNYVSNVVIFQVNML